MRIPNKTKGENMVIGIEFLKMQNAYSTLNDFSAFLIDSVTHVLFPMLGLCSSIFIKT